MDWDKVFRTIGGFGAGYHGKGQEYVANLQSMDDEKRREAAIDAEKARRLMAQGDIAGTRSMLQGRADRLKAQGRNIDNTMNVIQQLDAGNIEGVIDDLTKAANAGQKYLQPQIISNPKNGQAPFLDPVSGQINYQSFEGYDPQRGMAGTARSSMSPMYAIGPNNEIQAFQLNNMGGATPVALPEGFSPLDPYSKAYQTALGAGTGKTETARGAAREGAIGKGEGEAAINEPKRQQSLNTQISGAENVVRIIDETMPKVGAWTSGLLGSAAAKIPGTPAYDLGQNLLTIKANLGFDRLQRMRDESPTGGALGQVAVQELNALQASLDSLDQAQSDRALGQGLLAVKKHYNNWMKVMRDAKSMGALPQAPSSAPAKQSSIDDLVNKYAN